MKQTSYFLSIAFCMALCGSCSSYLEEYSQDTDYVRTWKDLDELLIGNCYLPVYDSYYLSMTENVGQWLHVMGDEVDECQQGYSSYAEGNYREKAFGYFTWQQRVGQNETFTDYNTENETWTKVYYCINVANNIIYSASEVPVSSEADQQGLHKVLGEAHFLRATYYFWLANLYGKPYNPATCEEDPCVPLKVSAIVEDRKFDRQSVAEVYRQVLSDLGEAEQHLSQYRKAKTSIYRADSTACHLLLSRVHLYMQHWDEAARYARKVIAAHPTLLNLNNATIRFSTKNNPENLFSMGGSDVPCIFNYICQSFTVSDDLYSNYSAQDLRRSGWYWKKGNFVGPIRTPLNTMYLSYDATSTQYYTLAFSESHTKQEVSSLFLFRSAEAYLNLSEAEAYLGHEEAALTALNTLRTARFANGSDYQVTATGEALVSAIRRERRLELALEGHRWFDLRRYQVCAVLPESKQLVHQWTTYSSHSATKMTGRNTYVLEPFDAAYTLNIPQEVLNFNTGMPNNPRPWRTAQ